MSRFRGNEIRVGDEFTHLWFMGGPGVVKSLRPYRGPLLSSLGAGTQVASFVGYNFEMTLSASEHYEVNRAALAKVLS